MCCSSAKHVILRRKRKDWLTRNREIGSEWSAMSTSGLLFQLASTMDKLSRTPEFNPSFSMGSVFANFFSFLCCVVCILCPVLSVSLDCPFLVVLLVLSNVYCVVQKCPWVFFQGGVYFQLVMFFSLRPSPSTVQMKQSCIAGNLFSIL